ncbi:MAG TPA: hypothetical protein PLM29_05935, partial [Deltaproteobacteria bacterium]|nr:hypothetical protein [Deltaproteobacteria bacterium]
FKRKNLSSIGSDRQPLKACLPLPVSSSTDNNLPVSRLQISREPLIDVKFWARRVDAMNNLSHG